MRLGLIGEQPLTDLVGTLEAKEKSTSTTIKRHDHRWQHFDPSYAAKTAPTAVVGTATANNDTTRATTTNIGAGSSLNRQPLLKIGIFIANFKEALIHI